jgi:hypothetical protein
VDWWVWLLLGAEALIVVAGAASLVRVYMGPDRERAQSAEIGRRAWETRDAAERRHAERVATREREIAGIVMAWGPDNLASLSSGDRAIRALAECWALWPHVSGQPVAAIRAAAEALTLDVDSPSLRELAGLSERHADASEVLDLLAIALDELEVVAVSPDSDEGQLLALRYYCLQWRDGRISDAELVELAYSTIGYHGSLVARDLVELEDILTTPIGSAHEEVEQAVDRFLSHVVGLKSILN